MFLQPFPSLFKHPCASQWPIFSLCPHRACPPAQASQPLLTPPRLPQDHRFPEAATPEFLQEGFRATLYLGERGKMVLGGLSGGCFCTTCSLFLLRLCVYLGWLCGLMEIIGELKRLQPPGMQFCFSQVLLAQGLSWSCGRAGVWAPHSPAVSLPCPLPSTLGSPLASQEG